MIWGKKFPELMWSSEIFVENLWIHISILICLRSISVFYICGGNTHWQRRWDRGWAQWPIASRAPSFGGQRPHSMFFICICICFLFVIYLCVVFIFIFIFVSIASRTPPVGGQGAMFYVFHLCIKVMVFLMQYVLQYSYSRYCWII